MVGRILNQDPSLYADIEMLNPKAKESIKQFMKSAKKLQRIINKKDKKAFISYFKGSGMFLGDFRRKASKESDFLIDQLVKEKDI